MKRKTGNDEVRESQEGMEVDHLRVKPSLSEEEARRKLLQSVTERMDRTRQWSEQQIRDLLDDLILKLCDSYYMTVSQKTSLKRDLYAELRGWGILQEFLEDDTVTEIMVNGPDQIFLERAGNLYPTSKKFASSQKLEELIQQMVSAVNRTVNASRPIADIRLEDGSRVNVVLPPVALNGPIVTIRKFPKEGMNMERLISLGALTEEAASFLQKVVQAKYNIFVCGGTGSGKTTFLNALSQFISPSERVITIEDSAELQLQDLPNLVRLETRIANLEGKNAISIRDLIKTALRMRPDRIVIGEIRDQAAYDLLAAWNTGHDGSLSTIHANSPQDMISRLSSLVLLGVELPLPAIRDQIASAVDLIVHVSRLRDGSRRVTQIAELCRSGEIANRSEEDTALKGVIAEDSTGAEIEINPLFMFKEEGTDEEGHVIGALIRTEFPMRRLEKWRRAGHRDGL